MSIINVDMMNYSDVILKNERNVAAAYIPRSSDYFPRFISEFEAAAAESASFADFALIDTDASPELAMIAGVITFPTVIAFSDGAETERLCGLVSRDGAVALMSKLK